jgi:hypothetical protein
VRASNFDGSLENEFGDSGAVYVTAFHKQPQRKWVNDTQVSATATVRF